MREKDYRELQISSSLLIFIFFMVIVLGVFIFLLGVSVGKKQSAAASATDMPTRQESQQLSQEQVSSQEILKPDISSSGKPASREESREPPSETTKKEPESVAQKIPPQAVQAGHFYIQVAAFNNQQSAMALVNTLKEKGYPALVLQPQPGIQKKVYRVRVGSFLTREEAEKMKAKLQSASPGKADYFIVKD